MTIENGYIRLYRSLLKWEWYKVQNTKDLFLHFLLTANFKATKYKGETVGRGQRIVSLRELSDELDLSIQEIRTSIKHLKSTQELTQEPTQGHIQKSSLFTVLNFDYYQSLTQETTQGVTNQQHIANTSTENKNDKNLKKEKEDNPQKERKVKSKQEIRDIRQEIKQSILNKNKEIEVLSAELFESVIDWLEYKDEIGFKYKDTGLTKLLNHIENEAKANGSKPVIDVINLSIENGWQGIIWDKLVKPENRGGLQIL